MKVAAMTMVYRDYWALSQWYKHHGSQLGERNLFVVSHGHDSKISEICPQASIITVPRDDLNGFDRNRAEMLNAFHAGLLQSYNWVMRTDADELICWDPARYNGLVDVFEKNTDWPVLTALGFDLVHMDGDKSGDALASHRNAAFSGHYSKSFASRRPVSFVLHGTKVAPKRLETFPFRMAPGVYLAHLKYADTSALDAATRVRKAVANGPGKGLPGPGWSRADEDAVKFFATFVKKDVVDWAEAERRAYAALSSKPARDERWNLVKARALKFDFRTELPSWFAEL
ncbi:glycosyltransferase family 2 protein [Thalassococcus sp. CAU 1522]|uniref:Glycosyltransferase family 2 protein n=1 Tax=Thalassococcus arenae TaxID=2851652 RepID=A0ABS6N561_9RHOB|nr:glycosyltransferase family 2 protein [Thalassococcus arenae]MBV2359156.1 glycosyltransferase family 2 protein [Thalassococcus arenae]